MSIKRYGFIAFFLAFVLFITTVILPVSAFEPYYDLYAYGDSTTALSSNYLVQYQSLFEPAKTISHSTDGSGMNSMWGLENIRDNFHNNATDIFVMFGINDMNTINGTRVGINTDGICDAIEENGSVCHIMIHTMMANNTLWGGHSLYEIQVENITDEEIYFDSIGRSYVKLYDAIDTIPCNNYADPVNMSFMDNEAHPNTIGHEYMARYLYNSTDYCKYWSGKDEGAPVTAPVAAFTSDIQTGTAPLAVQFMDQSTGTGITAWAWDFNNDGTIDDTTENPVHTFASADTYTVNLTVTNDGGSDSEEKSAYITVGDAPVPAPVADFTGTPLLGNAPLTVTFTDTSTNTPTSWSWDFGDGDSTNATVQNPVHTFASADTYTVNLTVTNDGGSDSENKTPYVTVNEAPVLVSKIGVFRPSTQRFYLDTSGDGKWDAGDSQYAFGLSGDLPVAGDWNNDDIIKIGVFRPSTQRFYLDTSGDGKWGAWDSQYAFGLTGDLPVAGDWTNDDTTEIGVFRPSTQRFYLDISGDGKWGSGDSVIAFGRTGDLPVTGDWNDDGMDEIGVFRPSKQRFYLDTSGDGKWDAGDSQYAFGLTGDLPVAGDWNDDDTDEIGVFRPSTQRFYLDTSGDGKWGSGDSVIAFGRTEDRPVAGMWR